MVTLTNERFAPITSSAGYLNVELSEALAALSNWRTDLYGATKVTQQAAGFPEVLSALEPLTQGAIPRELLIGMGEWTAYFNCELRGTEATSPVGHLSRVLGCPAVIMKNIPHTYGAPGIKQGRRGAIQFELFGPIPTEFLNYVRSVSVVADWDKWKFSAAGTEQAFEEPAAYVARRVRDRFTPEMLERYCKALGIDVFEEAAYGPLAYLVESPAVLPSNATIKSLREAQEWLEII